VHRRGWAVAAGDDVLTIDELAEYLKVSKSTLYKLVQAGKVPGQKVGKHWRFRRATIDKWLDARAKPARRRRAGR
jgi:excisionase family DNA binding protein